MRSLKIAVAFLSIASLSATTALAAEELVTGSATFDISLSASGAAMALSNINGRMVEKITRRCDTYRMEVDLDAELVGPSGQRLPLTIRSRITEAVDSLEFDHSSELASVEVDSSVGKATRIGGVLSVSLTKPSEKTTELNGDFLFPIALLKAALAAAKQGEIFVQFDAFEGSSGGDPWNVSIVISPAGEAESIEHGDIATGLGFGDLKRWRMKLSYFKAGQAGEGMPLFSSEAIVYENGFSLAAVYDMGTFAMRLKLAEFTPIPPVPCP